MMCPTPRHTQSYLVYFRCQNLNLPESLEGIIIGLSKQSDWFPSFPKPANYLYKHSDAKDTLTFNMEGKMTSREVLIVYIDSLPVATVSLAASLLLVPVLTLD